MEYDRLLLRSEIKSFLNAHAQTGYPETTNATYNKRRREKGDPWQVVPRQVFTPCDCLLISVAFVVLFLGHRYDAILS